MMITVSLILCYLSTGPPSCPTTAQASLPAPSSSPSSPKHTSTSPPSWFLTYLWSLAFQCCSWPPADTEELASSLSKTNYDLSPVLDSKHIWIMWKQQQRTKVIAEAGKEEQLFLYVRQHWSLPDIIFNMISDVENVTVFQRRRVLPTAI